MSRLKIPETLQIYAMFSTADKECYAAFIELFKNNGAISGVRITHNFDREI